jgi:hypothetical protein
MYLRYNPELDDSPRNLIPVKLSNFLANIKNITTISGPECYPDLLLKYVLTGIYTNEERHVFNHESEMPTAAQVVNNIRVQRDLDSLIGHIKDPNAVQLPYKCAINVFPVARPSDVLKKDNHLKTRITLVSEL